MFLLKKNNNLIFCLILLLCLSIPVIIWLGVPGFFQSDDGSWMIIRFSAFYEALKDGQFPVRFLGRLNHGYGYPVSNFLYPGFMYLAAPLHLLGANFTDTIKILFGLFYVSSGIFCFLWFRKIFNNFSAFVGSLFYLYTPYHLFDLYSRGSIGEMFALAILPFVLWQIERKSFLGITFGTALLIISHNTLAVLFLPLIILYVYFSRLNPNRFSLYQYTGVLVFVLGLSAFYWAPGFFELAYTKFSSTQVSSPQEYFAQKNLIGISSIFVLIISLVIFIRNNNKIAHKNLKELSLLFIVISLLAIFLSSNLSFLLWDLIPSSFIQFPWRLLSFAIVGISFLASYVIFSFKKSFKYYISVIFLIFLLISSYGLIKPSAFINQEDTFYSTNEATTTVMDEYMPIWVKIKPSNRYEDKVETIRGKGEVKNLDFNNSKKINFNYNSQTDSIIRINTIYYPGWKAYANGEEKNIDYTNEKGLIEFSLAKGDHKIEVNFSETPLRLFADFISVISLLTILVITKYHKFS